MGLRKIVHINMLQCPTLNLLTRLNKTLCVDQVWYEYDAYQLPFAKLVITHIREFCFLISYQNKRLICW